jgi:hypothetical protein
MHQARPGFDDRDLAAEAPVLPELQADVTATMIRWRGKIDFERESLVKYFTWSSLAAAAPRVARQC